MIPSRESSQQSRVLLLAESIAKALLLADEIGQLEAALFLNMALVAIDGQGIAPTNRNTN